MELTNQDKYFIDLYFLFRSILLKHFKTIRRIQEGKLHVFRAISLTICCLQFLLPSALITWSRENLRLVFIFPYPNRGRFNWFKEPLRKHKRKKWLLLHLATGLKVHTNTLTEICFQVLFAHVVAKLLIPSELNSIFGPSADNLIKECTELHNDEIRNPILFFSRCDRLDPLFPLK